MVPDPIEARFACKRVVRWDQGVGAVHEVVSGSPGRSGPIVVGITGPVGSGKSTLAGLLSPCVIRTDDYLPDYDTLAEHERDLPEHADLALLARHLAELSRGRGADVPTWCFHEHRRTGSRRVEPAPMIVCEGIHALHERVAPALHVGVYVHSPRGDRWARWEAIEAGGQRGWGVDRARAYFDAVAEPTFFALAAAYVERADVIVLNPGPPTP